MQNHHFDHQFVLRTKTSNSQCIISAYKNKGMKFASCLLELEYYHLATNYSVDIMHDILEGVAPFEVALLLNFCITSKKLFTLDDLNTAISLFRYGPVLAPSKPSAISSAKLKIDSLGQKAHQMLIILYTQPLMIADRISENDPHWNLFLTLLYICNLVFSSVISSGHVSYLRDLIAVHHKTFKLLYPEKNLKYKHHRMVHYTLIIMKSGPLLSMCVICNEAKHKYFKRLAHIVCNFQNIRLTPSTRH